MLEGVIDSEFSRVIISDVRHSTPFRKPSVFIRNHGRVLIDQPYTFIAKKYSKEAAEKLVLKLNEDERLGNCKIVQFGPHLEGENWSAYNVVHVVAPAADTIIDALFPIIKVDGKKKKRAKTFVSPQYTQQLRWKFSNPGGWADVDTILLDNLKLKTEFNSGIEELKKNIIQLFPNTIKQQREDIFNDLAKALHSNSPSQFNGLPREIIEAGTKLSTIRTKIKNYCRIAPYAGGELELLLDSFNTIRPLRYLDAEEIMQQKWGFLDIETPEFMNPGGGDISWAGLSYVQNGVPMKKEVHTLSMLPKKFYKGYEVFSHESEEKLLTAERDSIKRENPLFLSAYNAKYDFLHSRDAHPDFAIGEDDTRPRMEVHIKNLERVGINGRMVIDLYRWAQIAFPKLPNYSLETVAKHIFGDGKFEKKLGEEVLTKDEHYAKLAAIDRKARAGDMQEAETGLNYVTDDVDILPEILNSNYFQLYAKHAAWISQKFKIPYSHLFYSLRSINKAQDEYFLKVLKLPRTETRRMDEDSTAERKQAQIMFRKYLEGKLDTIFEVFPKGPVSDVAIACVPYGYYLRHLISRRFSMADEIYKRQADSSLSDFERLIYAQFGNTLAEYLVTDYGILRDRKKAVNNYEHQLTFGKEKEFEKLNRLLESQIRNIEGNYDVRPREIEDAMNLMGADIVNSAKKNNLAVISHEGSFIYLKGDGDNVFSGSPLIKVASLGDVIINIKDKKQRVIYEKYGTHNKRSSREKTIQLPFRELAAYK